MLNYTVRPRYTIITGNTTVYADGTNKVRLTCRTDSSNPPSTITWYRGGQKVISDQVASLSTGEYGGNVMSQVLEFVAKRDMDGQVVECRVTNELSGNQAVTQSVQLDILCMCNFYTFDNLPFNNKYSLNWKYTYTGKVTFRLKRLNF